MAFHWLEIFFFAGVLFVLTPLLGRYIVMVFQEQAKVPCFLFGWLERASYRIGGINPKEEMSWVGYGKALLLFNVFGFIALWALQMAQGFLPLNPQAFSGVEWVSAFNTSISFVTNTNWQAYAGETTMSYLTQMLGLTSQNFLSAATGMATLLALTRGLIRTSSETLGNFWADLVRTVVYLLLPLSVIMAFVLVAEGSIQTLSPYVEVTTLENEKQTIPLGPVASQVAIKQLGTNGGGFFNANSAHPFENPTSFTNLLEMIAIILIPAASVYAYGVMIGSPKQGFLILGVMSALWLFGAFFAVLFERIDQSVFPFSPHMEGQETRIGNVNSVLWAVSTTATSNGSVNAMLSSLSPISGGIALFNIMSGELIFGGIGVGLCSMIMFILLTVFLSGLMVGRTPEYLGKKIGKKEMQWVVMAVLMPGALILAGAGLSCVMPAALQGLLSQGPHGLSEILYAFSSAAGNNGSAFAGLNANTLFYNLSLGIVMLIGRVAIVMPSLAVAGLLAKKISAPPSRGTFSTDSILFAVLLLGVILIVGGLTFFPALSLGPIVEHLLMSEGRTF